MSDSYSKVSVSDMARAEWVTEGVIMDTASMNW